ncbi:MAG: (d)CMP kinase [Planctomycetota bacterium]|nr:(d)CMP kinase [Planctomycetota bacterium]
MIVAIDGPAGSGKSTAARNLAGRLGLTYINTGAMYRAVALLAVEAGLDLEDEDGIVRIARSLDIRFEQDRDEPRYIVHGKDRTADLFSVGLTSRLEPVVNSPRVRAALVDKMREMAARAAASAGTDRDGGVVMEGRDIGTVVFPDADCKFYLHADLAERARRRASELAGRGERVDIAEIERQIEARDEIDRRRETGPLKKAEDAIDVDTSRLSPEETLETLIAHIMRRKRTGR